MSNWGSAALCIVVIGVCAYSLAGCGGSAKQAPPPERHEPQVVQGDFYMEMEEPPPGASTQTEGGACCAKPVQKDQPPEVKLALGHYSNARRGIGAVVDVTTKVAKLKYDGTDKIIELYGSPGAYGRTDYYKNASTVLMQVWDDGRVVVFLPDSPTARGGITLVRDADADPL